MPSDDCNILIASSKNSSINKRELYSHLHKFKETKLILNREI
jgi:hypothetical protein